MKKILFCNLDLLKRTFVSNVNEDILNTCNLFLSLLMSYVLMKKIIYIS